MNDETDNQPRENPLNQQYWMKEHFPKTDFRLLPLAEIVQGIDALARLLTNNNRLIEEAADSPEEAPMEPINSNLTAGLFSALTALTSAAYSIACGMVERSSHERAGTPTREAAV